MDSAITGVLAGLAAAPAWIVVNLFVDLLFVPVIRRHADQLNPVLMAKPGLNLIVLTVDIAFWGALFGSGYGLFHAGLERFGWGGGMLWGLFMFLGFSRSIIESSLWAKVPRDMNVFWFVEGVAGLLAWGAALGLLFPRFG